MCSLQFFYIFIITQGVLCQIDFVPQIIELIETAVIPDKGTAYLNCTMVISEALKPRAQWYNVDENKLIAKGNTLEQPVRKDADGLDKYIVNFINKRPSFVPVMPGQSVDVWNYQLIIRKFLDSDSKNYQCKIDLSGFDTSEKPSANGKVILQKAPYITPIPSQIIDEGSALDIDCIAKGSPAPRVSWTRANGEAFPIPNSPQRINGSRLLLPKMGRSDRGVYRCHATNNVGRADEYDIMVEVNFRPTARPARRMGAYAQMADQNYEITMECIVNGYPDPDLYWYKGNYDPLKNNVPLTNDVRYESQKIISYGSVGMNVTDVFFVIKILNVIEGDFGNYSCRAQNEKGDDVAIINFFGERVCQGPLCYMGRPAMPGFAVLTARFEFWRSLSVIWIGFVFSHYWL